MRDTRGARPEDGTPNRVIDCPTPRKRLESGTVLKHYYTVGYKKSLFVSTWIKVDTITARSERRNGRAPPGGAAARNRRTRGRRR